MALEQTILFTVMPHGISIDAEQLPVSVFVTPRLSGGEQLGQFRDWLYWTENLKENGLELVFQTGTNEYRAAINPDPLQPALWGQLFKEDTLVRSHSFDDYSQRSILTFSMRDSLSALKAIYQEASLTLALPDSPRSDPREQGGNRTRLRELVNGLQVHWDGRLAPRWRQAVRFPRRSFLRTVQGPRVLDGPLDNEGLVAGKNDPTTLQQIAVPFAVFHHMPTPKYDEPAIGADLDKEKLLDFHQALSALNSYPELMRALGIVFDFDLPRDAVPETGDNPAYSTLLVSQVAPGWDWAVAPTIPPLATGYIHRTYEDQRRYFFAAPLGTYEKYTPHIPLTVVGLLELNPESFGLAQVDVDGGMHKAIMLAENLNPSGDHNLDPSAQPANAPHPEVFDPDATLPALRSGGFSLYADRRALQLLDTLDKSKAFNDAVTGGGQERPFFAEDLVRGYRLDVWDSHTGSWHSLHQRNSEYQVGDLPYTPDRQPEEGFVQLALTQPAKAAQPASDDLYLHEAVARWAGWSLSVPRPSKHLSRYANAADAVPRDDEPEKFAEDQPETPFKVTAVYKVPNGSLPRLRFGARYRLRARAVDLAGNSLEVGDSLADLLAAAAGLPRNPDGSPYLRFEPVPAPLVVLRDPQAVKNPGSALDRLVIRTYNDHETKDSQAADLTAADRHILPPRTSVELGERLGMFDDSTGRLKGDAATWQLIAERDAGELNKVAIDVAGRSDEYPLEPADRIDDLPYLPDPLARGAAIRDLPGTPSGEIGRAAPVPGPAGPLTYEPLSDPNPRPGSATLIGFASPEDWTAAAGFRLALAEPASGQTDLRPAWDPDNRSLTVYLAKGHTAVVPLTSYLEPRDLKLMGVWQWLRQYIEQLAKDDPRLQTFSPGEAVDRIAHVLQRAVEGGHWMLTPPHLLTLVHAVQQPLGKPEFGALNVEHVVMEWDKNPLQTAPARGVTDPTELAPVTAWRRPGATEAYLIGSLRLHGASTVRVDLLAEWDDPVDDIHEAAWATVHHSAAVEELPLPDLRDWYLTAPGPEQRRVGYYDPEHDQIAWVRNGDQAGESGNTETFIEAAPRHLFNDPRRHIVRYTALATSRFQEYFDPDQVGGFTRTSDPVEVDVPASARPLAPDIAYVVPSFAWQRQAETNLKRSVRFGGGLRVYLRRPWFSSGEGELLGVALWSLENGYLNAQNRDQFKPFFTQWGMDPIWQTGNLGGAPGTSNFPDSTEQDYGVSLEEGSARMGNQPGHIDVAGYPVEYDAERRLWFADLTLDTGTDTYMPFVRLALVRYQPHALAEARVSRVVLADFAQLTPGRAALVTADPYHPRSLRVVVSGVAPRGPLAQATGIVEFTSPPTKINVRVQQHDPSFEGDLAWQDAPQDVAQVQPEYDGPVEKQPDLVKWAGTVTFTRPPNQGEFRLLITETEYISAGYVDLVHPAGEALPPLFAPPGRTVYAELVEIDAALVPGEV